MTGQVVERQRPWQQAPETLLHVLRLVIQSAHQSSSHSYYFSRWRQYTQLGISLQSMDV